MKNNTAKIDCGYSGADRILSLLRVAGIVDKDVSRLIVSSGLSPVKFAALSVILSGTESNPCTPSIVAKRLGRVRHAVTTLVERMVRDGLITVRDHPGDRRSVILEATDAGSAAFLSASRLLDSGAWSIIGPLGLTDRIVTRFDNIRSGVR
jgi:DNA-binding MarR family transcriptional regulator